MNRGRGRGSGRYGSETMDPQAVPAGHHREFVSARSSSISGFRSGVNMMSLREVMRTLLIPRIFFLRGEIRRVRGFDKFQQSLHMNCTLVHAQCALFFRLSRHNCKCASRQQRKPFLKPAACRHTLYSHFQPRRCVCRAVFHPAFPVPRQKHHHAHHCTSSTVDAKQNQAVVQVLGSRD